VSSLVQGPLNSLEDVMIDLGVELTANLLCIVLVGVSVVFDRCDEFNLLKLTKWGH